MDFLRDSRPRADANGLPVWFDNLLPERGSELRLRLSALHGLREGQSFELLRALGTDLIGAVEARTADGHQERPARDESASVDAASTDDRESMRMSGLTGIQMKFSMSMVNERLVLPARSGNSEWIVKIAGHEYPELAAVEAATMTWAKHAGFVVPPHMTIAFDRLDGIPDGWVSEHALAYAVMRFDRRDDGSRIHQEDLCQALAMRPQDKYGDGDPKVSFDGALRLITDVCGEEDGREMARRIGFMIASGNTDAHLKNWTIVWGDRQRPTLSPCYDLVATISWDHLGWAKRRGPELALRLGGERRFERLDVEQLAAFSAASRAWAADEVNAGISRARDSWEAGSCDLPIRMRAAIDAHWRAVPLLRRHAPA